MALRSSRVIMAGTSVLVAFQMGSDPALCNAPSADSCIDFNVKRTTLARTAEASVTDTPEDSKLTKTKSRWAELGKFLTGMTSRPQDSRLPPGQHLVKNWPVLDLGQTPNIAKENWRLD